MILSKKMVESFDEILKYLDPNPLHLGLNHYNPSTLIQVFFLKIFVIIPNGPFAELT